MKRFAILTCLFFIILGSVQLSAQSSTASTPTSSLDKSSSIRSPSDYYPVRVDVTKVFSNSLGYRVVYRRGESGFADVYLPNSWFVSGGKGILIPSTDPSVPYMVVYYKADGSFSHVKLYVQTNLSHPTWGSLTGDVADKFKVETVKILF